MVRYGDVLSLLGYRLVVSSESVGEDEGEGEGAGDEAGCKVSCVVAPEYAVVALASAVAVSFAAVSANASGCRLHSSRRRVQLRRGAPVVSIARLHRLETQVRVPGDDESRPGEVPVGLSNVGD